MKGYVMTSEMLKAEKYLDIVRDRGERNLELRRVYHNMRDEGLFLLAYGKLYSNKGAMTEGIDPEDSIQGMSMDRIQKIIQRLKDGTYHWKPARRVYVPKADGNKRPISIPSWEDKLVQEVMRMILEAYYEPQFRESSHGFRPNRGCGTALRSIKRKWKGTKWFIEGDIRGCFDNINHQTLLDLLGRNIKDERFLKLVRGLLKAGYMEDWRYHETFSGTPQGGVISPILSNIVLHELDKYVEDILIPKYIRGRRRARHPGYQSLGSRKEREKKQGDIEAVQEIVKEMRKLPSVDTHDPDFRRLKYCRYADDFLLGFQGPRSEAEAIKAELKTFLQTIGLELSDEKTRITHAQSQPALFLGYEISVAGNRSKISKDTSNPRRKIRRVNGVIQLRVPRSVVTKWRRKYSKGGKPARMPSRLRLSDFEIVTMFGAELRGLCNYYSMAQNYGKACSTIRWYCMESLRKTLCNKHRLGIRESYARYYSKPTKQGEFAHMRVEIPREGKRPLVARCGETPLKVKQTVYLEDEIPSMFHLKVTGSELVQRLLAEKCELCGHEGYVEVHHEQSIKSLKSRWEGRRAKPRWVEAMLLKRRKTLVVCKPCHTKITFGVRRMAA
jgi:group II intron reverse transcriptase/maturase